MFFIAMANDCLFMQVTAAPVSNSHEKVLSPALMANLGLILSPFERRHNFKQFIAGGDRNGT
jgi:hypothetical protein